MGNQTFKEFEEKSIDVGSMKGTESYLLSSVTKEESTFEISSKGLTGKRTNYLINDEIVYRSKSNLSGKRYTFTDGDNQFLSFQVITTKFKGSDTWIYKSTPTFEGHAASDEKLEDDKDTTLYLVAHMQSKDTMTTAECSIKVVTGVDEGGESGFQWEEIMKAYKISTMGFNVYIEDMDGKCIAKCTPKGKMSFSPKIVIAQGTDPVLIFNAIMTTAPGGGGSAGALAGAGVV